MNFVDAINHNINRLCILCIESLSDKGVTDVISTASTMLPIAIITSFVTILFLPLHSGTLQIALSELMNSLGVMGSSEVLSNVSLRFINPVALLGDNSLDLWTLHSEHASREPMESQFPLKTKAG